MGDTTKPSAPQSLNATAGSANQVSLSWLTSTDNVGVTGYNIYRGGVRLATSSTDGVYFSQREASRFQPQLVVTF